MMLRAAMIATTALLLAASADAAVIVDQSPDISNVTAGFAASNYATGQNFLVKFTLGTTTTIGGIDIYSEYGSPTIGTPTLVKLRTDVGGSPNTVNDYAFASFISAIDSVGSSADPSIKRLHGDFTATTLAAGDYWIGMSGTASDIAWNIRFNYPGGDAWQLSGDNLQFSFGGRSAFAFRIDGVSSPTPEPAAWALMIGGFGLVGTALRRRRTAAFA